MMVVLVRCFTPEHYDAANHAVIEVNEELILMLDKRLAQARAMWESGFFGTKWWDWTPYFIPCSGPDSVGSDMSEDDFDQFLDANHFVRLADDFKRPDNYAPMSPIVLTVCASEIRHDGRISGSFLWTGTDKHIGANGRVETYEQHEDVVDEWAELIGCTEMLAKVRSCRGVK